MTTPSNRQEEIERNKNIKSVQAELNKLCDKQSDEFENTSCIIIDQNATIDSAGCTLYSTIISLSYQLTKMLGRSINIDVVALLACFEKFNPDFDINKPLHPFVQGVIDKFGPISNKPIRIWEYLLGGQRIRIPIKCDCDNKQKIPPNNIQDPSAPYDCAQENSDSKSKCWITIKVEPFKTVDKNPKSVFRLFHAGIKNGIMPNVIVDMNKIAKLVKYDAQLKGWYVVIDQIDPDPTNGNIINPEVHKEVSSAHALCCIGYSCTTNYICYKFHDSYTFDDESISRQPRVFNICINKNILAEAWVDEYLFFIGVVNILVGQGGTLTRFFGANISEPPGKNQINDNINKCCDTTYDIISSLALIKDFIP